MELSSRQSTILALVQQQGAVEVESLAEQYQVSVQTIRRDLNVLCARGLVARMHGGARQLTSISSLDYEQRRSLSGKQKQAIASLAAELIPNHCSVMLNIGTTTEQVAKSLYQHQNLVVISNNINVINILMGSQVNSLILAGGTVRQSDGAIIGEAAVDFIARFKADFAIIGCSAIDEDGAFLDFDSSEVSVAKAILDNSRTKIMVGDSGKFGKTAPYRISHLSQLDYFITDQKPDEKFCQIAQQAETKILF
jgi:DeoR family glycerol-3-phosphate regulon repressor